jgi:ribonuclease-3
MIFRDNGIDGTRFFGVKLSIDKVIAKARATSKAEKKASQRTYFALQEKWTKIISYSSKLHRFRS